ncbi:MAG TPA: hypothetical protein VF656_19185 [Pyrinomonadaceae bacterium]|jgi:hypothetical protein
MFKLSLKATLRFAPAILLLSAACALPTGGGGGGGVGGSGSNWTTHEDPAGFAVEIPSGWQVNSDNGRISIFGASNERVTIYPLKVAAQLDADSARKVLLGVASQFWPKQKWDMPKGGWQFGTNGVRAVGDDGGVRETVALWWANTPAGASCFFYEVAAEGARFQSAEETFARILKSFRVTRAAPNNANSNPLSAMQFQRWTDPTENAFSLEVPVGWNTTGGIKRFGGTSRASEWVIQSPDEEVSMRSGDVTIPTQFVEPSETVRSFGYREGQTYAGTNWIVMRYLPAMDFATDYVQRTVGGDCGDIRWLAQKDRADYVEQMMRNGLLVPSNNYTAAEVTFTCQQGGEPHVGYLFVITSATNDMGVGRMWSVSTLYGFFATAARASEADAVLQRGIASFEINPQWYAAERGAERQMAEDFRRSREYAAQLQQQTQAERWASWERITEQRGDILAGQTRVVDPESGQAYKVQSGSNYYWVDPNREVIVGTNQPYKPTWDFREMIETYR